MAFNGTDNWILDVCFYGYIGMTIIWLVVLYKVYGKFSDKKTFNEIKRLESMLHDDELRMFYHDISKQVMESSYGKCIAINFVEPLKIDGIMYEELS